MLAGRFQIALLTDPLWNLQSKRLRHPLNGLVAGSINFIMHASQCNVELIFARVLLALAG